MSEQFIPANSVHLTGTRYRNNECFTIPKVKCFGKISFVYYDCVLWNDYPNGIKNLQRHQPFKMADKSHFLDSIKL